MREEKRKINALRPLFYYMEFKGCGQDIGSLYIHTNGFGDGGGYARWQGHGYGDGDPVHGHYSSHVFIEREEDEGAAGLGVGELETYAWTVK